MSKYYPNTGDWVRGYGGRKSHKIINVIETHGSIGTYRANFACGKHSDFIEWGEDSGNHCAKCEAVEQGRAADAATLSSAETLGDNSRRG